MAGTGEICSFISVQVLYGAQRAGKGRIVTDDGRKIMHYKKIMALSCTWQLTLRVLCSGTMQATGVWNSPNRHQFVLVCPFP